MGIKEKLLALLEEHSGDFVSGEEIGQRLAVSRTAVWKAMNTLRGEGYEIEAVPNRGYCLNAQADVLTARGITALLGGSWDKLRLEVLPSAVSTNALLREKANAGAPEGCAVIAGMQTGGRGRLGRSFYSPPDTGIYLSLLLRPEQWNPSQAVHITTMAAVAACSAIEEVSGRQAQIKWVNDIYMDGKKVCGILTEGAFSLENGSLDYAVLGVGINAYAPVGGFPEELEQIAGAVFTERRIGQKNRLAATFLNHFLEIYTGMVTDYAEQYREKSMVIGRQIDVLLPAGRKKATALDVDRDCRLVVRYEDGRVEALSSAEVSIRPV